MIATRTDPLSRTEGWVFANLHKWTFLDGIGSRPRDIAMSCAALLLVAGAATGLVMAWRTRPQRKRPKSGG